MFVDGDDGWLNLWVAFLNVFKMLFSLWNVEDLFVFVDDVVYDVLIIAAVLFDDLLTLRLRCFLCAFDDC